MWIIAGIAGALMLILLALKLFPPSFQEESRIEGDKGYVLSSIARLIQECFEKYEGRKESFICSEFYMSSSEEISSSDLLDYIDPTRVGRIRVEDLGRFGDIIIRYEDGIIYVERVEHERISS